MGEMLGGCLVTGIQGPQKLGRGGTEDICRGVAFGGGRKTSSIRVLRRKDRRKDRNALR